MKFISCLFFLSILFSLQCKKDIPPKLPNILLIISDDQAWTDYGFMGHPHIETPRLDQLAAQSLTFTHGYVAAPLCRPSLASMITGLYPHQHGVTGNDPAFDFEGPRYQGEWVEKRTLLNRQLMQNFYRHTLLTQTLDSLGYLSQQTGKWWEGSWEDGHFSKGMTHGIPGNGGRHGDAGLTIGRNGLQEIFSFIDSAQQNEKPFFVWYAPFLPHAPHTPPQELEEKYLPLAPTPAVARYWAMCEWFDQTCGDLLDYLERLNIQEETLVIYVCDNGWIQEPDQPNRFAARSKQSPYEGGIRTPIMFRWPGAINPLLDSTTLVSSIDIVPTVRAALGLKSLSALPGLNAMDLPALSQRSFLFAEAYEHDIADVQNPTQSLKYRVALNFPWKLIAPDTAQVPGAVLELFNLEKDPYERHNLVGTNPEKAAQLEQVMDQWWNPQQ